MGLFDKLFGKVDEKMLTPLDVADSDIVAPAYGQMIDVKSLPDPMFAEEMMGKTVAFKYEEDNVIICSPANGELMALFPTGHAFGVVTPEGVEILVHIGIDTVNAKGDGFTLYSKRQGDKVKAGDPIVKVNIKKMSQNYNMSTMLIITNPNGKEIEFIDPQIVKRGTSLLK